MKSNSRGAAMLKHSQVRSVRGRYGVIHQAPYLLQSKPALGSVYTGTWVRGFSRTRVYVFFYFLNNYQFFLTREILYIPRTTVPKLLEALYHKAFIRYGAFDFTQYLPRTTRTFS